LSWLKSMSPRSTDRFLTTHTGSLPRPADAAAEHRLTDARLTSLVRDVVERQAEAGIDVVSDGEVSKPDYVTYLTQRISGFGGEGRPLLPEAEVRSFPEWGEPLRAISETLKLPACIAALEPVDDDARGARRDAANLHDAAERAGVTGA
jgi:5-methyltetrahydropteroyltriglutamate--homocysteine methyltransferase